MVKVSGDDSEKLFGMKEGKPSLAIWDQRQKREFFDSLKHRKGVERTEFPIIVVADGEKVEANRQKPMRYADSYNDDLTPKSYATKGIGVRWSCLPTIKDEGVQFELDLEKTDFEGYVDYSTQRTEAGNTRKAIIRQPIFNSRTISTTASLKSGQTMILGGVSRRETCQEKDGQKIVSQSDSYILITAEILDEKARVIPAESP